MGLTIVIVAARRGLHLERAQKQQPSKRAKKQQPTRMLLKRLTRRPKPQR
jgi:hypothetical protein